MLLGSRLIVGVLKELEFGLKGVLKAGRLFSVDFDLGVMPNPIPSRGDASGEAGGRASSSCFANGSGVKSERNGSSCGAGDGSGAWLVTSLIKSVDRLLAIVRISDRTGVSGAPKDIEPVETEGLSGYGGSERTGIAGDSVTPLSSSTDGPTRSGCTCIGAIVLALGAGVENPTDGESTDGRSAGPNPSSANRASALALASDDTAGTFAPDAV